METLTHLWDTHLVGLNNAPAVFQALINEVIRDYLNHFVFIYLYDILVFSHSLAEHRLSVHWVLQRLLENRLFVKAEKCEFHAPSVTILCYIFQGREDRPGKIKAVVE